jgi:hypothetical protein
LLLRKAQLVADRACELYTKGYEFYRDHAVAAHAELRVSVMALFAAVVGQAVTERRSTSHPGTGILADDPPKAPHLKVDPIRGVRLVIALKDDFVMAVEHSLGDKPGYNTFRGNYNQDRKGVVGSRPWQVRTDSGLVK